MLLPSLPFSLTVGAATAVVGEAAVEVAAEEAEELLICSASWRSFRMFRMEDTRIVEIMLGFCTDRSGQVLHTVSWRGN